MPWWGWLVVAVPVLMILVVLIGGWILWVDTFAHRADPNPRDVVR